MASGAQAVRGTGTEDFLAANFSEPPNGTLSGRLLRARTNNQMETSSEKEMTGNHPSWFGRLYRRLVAKGRKPFPGSQAYWERRYASGGDSGRGSYDKFAEFKSDILNGFVKARGVNTVVEFGCGDGNQLQYAAYPSYLGVDVSPTAVAMCRRRFSGDESKRFLVAEEYEGERADMALSLDVIYHLVEDDVFTTYMKTLFDAAERYVIVYSSNFEQTVEYNGRHVRHRKFTSWVDDNVEGWMLIEHIPNRFPYGEDKTGSFADFYIFQKL